RSAVPPAAPGIPGGFAAVLRPPPAAPLRPAETLRGPCGTFHGNVPRLRDCGRGRRYDGPRRNGTVRATAWVIWSGRSRNGCPMTEEEGMPGVWKKALGDLGLGEAEG